jgi:GntP family gluconate:H+ symporter
VVNKPPFGEQRGRALMSGMPLAQALLLAASLCILVIATRSRRLHPFIAIVLVASAFGLAAGFSVGFLGKAFGVGFSKAIYSPGLVIVAAGFIAALAESIGASDQLAAKIERWRSLGPTRIATLLGLIAGIAASPAATFALLTPLIRPIGGATARKREAAASALALAISASHGVVLLAPVPIAAGAILDAAWGRVALFGLPVALLLAAVGAVWAHWVASFGTASQGSVLESDHASEKRSGGSAVVLLLATVVPLLMLMVQSIGDIPSEPFGGGPARERIIGVGRPLILFLVGVGIMAIGHWRQSRKLLLDSTWSERVLGDVAGIVMIVGAAAGLQRLCQETGMAELLGERLLAWPTALLVPFLVAAVIKSVQGSSLVAAIAAAGMVQPLLTPLGIGDETGKALATLAVGAGAMTVSHVNDEYFWLVAAGAGLSPLRAVVAVTIGTLLQGFAAVVTLLLLSVLVHHL